MYCFKYTNTPDIESGLNLVIKDVYIDETVGFQYVNVFTKGQDQGQPNDCSSMVISLKNETSIILTIRLDEVIGNKRISSISVTSPAILSKVLSNSVTLISCTDWTHFWIELSETLITIGMGKGYGSFILASIRTAITLDIRQILIKNGLTNKINHFAITDTEGRKVKSSNTQCQSNAYYATLDGHPSTCVPLEETSNIIEYTLTNGNGIRSNDTNCKLIFHLKMR
ncbi:DgyrCDS14548 [Dimorphilus gyrociliatus]|uniref:DgyrCDS14548 n=1 Tax=Dimorphilus gyrociliatus TaxID=2664684 RepID=A0A7I8WDZ6_9ANNE|nr:DgyrCDS14548 [Dimorphilus gyrociliatus]